MLTEYKERKIKPLIEDESWDESQLIFLFKQAVTKCWVSHIISVVCLLIKTVCQRWSILKSQ